MSNVIVLFKIFFRLKVLTDKMKTLYGWNETVHFSKVAAHDCSDLVIYLRTFPLLNPIEDFNKHAI